MKKNKSKNKKQKHTSILIRPFHQPVRVSSPKLIRIGDIVNFRRDQFIGIQKPLTQHQWILKKTLKTAQKH